METVEHAEAFRWSIDTSPEEQLEAVRTLSTNSLNTLLSCLSKTL